MRIRVFAAGMATFTVAIGAAPALLAQQMSYDDLIYDRSREAPPRAHPVRTITPEPSAYVSDPVVQPAPAPSGAPSYATGDTAYDDGGAYRSVERTEYAPYPDAPYAPETVPDGWNGYDSAGTTYDAPARYDERYDDGYTRPVYDDRAGYTPVAPYAAPPAPAYAPTYREERYEHAYEGQGYDAPPFPPRAYAARSGPPMPPAYDRRAWLNECRAYLQRARNDGATAGGLLGGAAGAIIGHEVAGRGDRLAGALIGGGVGGLAGLAIGAAIGEATRGDPYKRDCKAWLERYEDGYAARDYDYAPPPRPWDGGYSPSYPYGGYGGSVVVVQTPPMVPVMREYVVEEWVEDVPAPVAHRPAKRVRYVKQPAPRTKYIKLRE